MLSMLLIVTGASRGLGRAFAVAFAKNETSQPISYMRVMLVARSEEDLMETKQLMMEAAPSTLELEISIHGTDLSNLEKLDDQVNSLFLDDVQPMNHFQRTVLINNAGSLGHLGPCADIKSLRDFQHSLDLNITSSLWLSIRFVQEFNERKESTDQEDESSCVVVNVSSLCAVEPFRTMATYCAGKAARDMFHATIAKECGDDKCIKFLNYAPGACETNMNVELSTCDALDDTLKTYFRTAKAQGTLVQPADASRKLVKLVMENEFESGKHIDYWDLEDK